MEKRYKCVKSYTNKEIGEIYNENEKPNWFKNFNSIKEYREKGFRFWEYFKLVEEDLIKKDTFVLPERWKVLITDESKETLEKHRLTLPKQTSDVHSVLCDDAHGKFYLSTDKEYSDYQFWGKSRIENYTEITFEQFKTHILKEKTMEKEILQKNREYLQKLYFGWLDYFEVWNLEYYEEDDLVAFIEDLEKHHLSNKYLNMKSHLTISMLI